MEWLDIIKAVWKKAKVWVISFLITSLSTAYYFSKDVIADYRHRQHIAEFKSNMKESIKDTAVINGLLNNRDFVAIFFNNPSINKKIEELGIELHKKVVTNIINKDSSKVSTRDYISAGINMHPDSVLPFQLEVFKFFKRLEDRGVRLATDKDLDVLKEVLEAQNIRTEKPRRSPTHNDGPF